MIFTSKPTLSQLWDCKARIVSTKFCSAERYNLDIENKTLILSFHVISSVFYIFFSFACHKSSNPTSLPFPLRIDCAGILKLRNSDIELRKGETDIGRKNTRVRLVFRVHINQPNGRTVSLQASSNPIECCKSQLQLKHSRGVLWKIVKNGFCFSIHCGPRKRELWSYGLLAVFLNRWVLNVQMAIHALYLRPSTHAIDHASHFMTEGKSHYAETTLITKGSGRVICQSQVWLSSASTLKEGPVSLLN